MPVQEDRAGLTGQEVGPCERNGARAQVCPDSVCGTNESGLGRCPGAVGALWRLLQLCPQHHGPAVPPEQASEGSCSEGPAAGSPGR